MHPPINQMAFRVILGIITVAGLWVLPSLYRHWYWAVLAAWGFSLGLAQAVAWTMERGRFVLNPREQYPSFIFGDSIALPLSVFGSAMMVAMIFAAGQQPWFLNWWVRGSIAVASVGFGVWFHWFNEKKAWKQALGAWGSPEKEGHDITTYTLYGGLVLMGIVAAVQVVYLAIRHVVSGPQAAPWLAMVLAGVALWAFLGIVVDRYAEKNPWWDLEPHVSLNWQTGQTTPIWRDPRSERGGWVVRSALSVVALTFLMFAGWSQFRFNFGIHPGAGSSTTAMTDYGVPGLVPCPQSILTAVQNTGPPVS